VWGRQRAAEPLRDPHAIPDEPVTRLYLWKLMRVEEPPRAMCRLSVNGHALAKPRPPKVQRANVPPADRCFPPRLCRDGFDGDIVFDQTLVGHALSLTLTVPSEMGI